MDIMLVSDIVILSYECCLMSLVLLCGFVLPAIFDVWLLCACAMVLDE